MSFDSMIDNWKNNQLLIDYKSVYKTTVNNYYTRKPMENILL